METELIPGKLCIKMLPVVKKAGIKARIRIRATKAKITPINISSALKANPIILIKAPASRSNTFGPSLFF